MLSKIGKLLMTPFLLLQLLVLKTRAPLRSTSQGTSLFMSHVSLLLGLQRKQKIILKLCTVGVLVLWSCIGVLCLALSFLILLSC